MAIHCSSLAWEITRREESGGLQSMGLQRVGHDLATKPHQVNVDNRGAVCVQGRECIGSLLSPAQLCCESKTTCPPK